jgi:hypothetical protein
MSAEENEAAARALVAEHGADAPIFAAMEADARLGEADLDGALRWQAIVRMAAMLVRRRETTRH